MVGPLHIPFAAPADWKRLCEYPNCRLVRVDHSDTNSQRVDAPDLLGHGWAPRSSKPYTIPLIASHLATHISTEKYDVIAGVSIGSTAILPLLTQLKYPPARAVLVEPVLDIPAASDEHIAEMIRKCAEPPSEDELLKSNPKWVREEAILKRLALVQMDPRLIRDLHDVSFSSHSIEKEGGTNRPGKTPRRMLTRPHPHRVRLTRYGANHPRCRSRHEERLPCESGCYAREGPSACEVRMGGGRDA